MLLLDRIFSCPVSPSDVQLQRKTRAGENLVWNVFEEGEIWEDVIYMSGNELKPNKKDLKCVMITDFAYVMADPSTTDAELEKMKEISDFFEDKYDWMVSLFCEPFDLDGNGKLIIAFVPIGDTFGGYFNSSDFYEDIYPDESNNGDIIYLNQDYLLTDSFELIKLGGIHELQHLMNFSNDVYKQKDYAMPAWINEGLSMLTEYLSGDDYAKERACEFSASGLAASGEKSLIEFNNESVDYGQSLLFIQYLRLRFGDKVIKGIYDSYANDGCQIIEDATGVDFNTLYRDFCIMLMTTGRGLTTDPRYEIPAFSASPGDPDYTGINIRVLIDDCIPGTSPSLTAHRMDPYSFVLVPWNGNVTEIEYENTGAELTCFTL